MNRWLLNLRFVLLKQKDAKNYYSPAISRVIDYIYHGKNKTLTLNQLASLVNLTPKYLSALFHKETGQTLTVFIHKVLIEKAQNLLAHSDYSLGEISNYLNFHLKVILFLFLRDTLV